MDDFNGCCGTAHAVSPHYATLSVPSLQAQVQYVEGGSAAEELKVAVRLPSGEVVHLDGGSSPAAQTIDVEWRSVDDK